MTARKSIRASFITTLSVALLPRAALHCKNRRYLINSCHIEESFKPRSCRFGKLQSQLALQASNMSLFDISRARIVVPAMPKGAKKPVAMKPQ